MYFQIQYPEYVVQLSSTIGLSLLFRLHKENTHPCFLPPQFTYLTLMEYLSFIINKQRREHVSAAQLTHFIHRFSNISFSLQLIGTQVGKDNYFDHKQRYWTKNGIVIDESVINKNDF